VSQTEPAHTRSAIITELACISAELADMQVRNAEIATRVSRVIRDLSCTTAPVPPGADLQQLRQRLGAVRGRLEATAGEIKTSAERISPAAQAAPSPGTLPVAQNAGQPVQAREALDEAPEGKSGIDHRSGQSRECVTSAGAGGASAASADTAPAADPPRVPRREPEVRNAGGGIVQDGGSLKPAAATVEKAPLVRDVILRDGSTLRLRSPVPADFVDIKGLYDGLSPENRYRRFHGFGMVGDEQVRLRT